MKLGGVRPLTRLNVWAMLLCLLAGSVLHGETLRVAMFPYIPDAAGDGRVRLLRQIKADFERRYGYHLDLRPLNPEEDFYDLQVVTDWLQKPTDQGGYDVVEVDTVILQDIRNLIRAWPRPLSKLGNFYKAAEDAARIGGTYYAVPTWMCGYFLFTRSKQIAASSTGPELAAALRNNGKEQPRLVADFKGSWDLPAMYLNAWAETNGCNGVSGALTAPALDNLAVLGLQTLAKQCSADGQNPCIGGKYHDNDEGAIQFAQGRADALFGYSERLYVILRNGTKPEEIQIKTAPLGAGRNEPVWFVDGLVLRKDCDRNCLKAAEAFAEYLTRPRTRARIMMSMDAPEGRRIPRYLLAANRTTYQIKMGSLYDKLRLTVGNGTCPLPNGGLSAQRKRLKADLDAALKQ